VHGLQGHPYKTWACSRSSRGPSSSAAAESSSASQAKGRRRDAVRRAVAGPLRRLSTTPSFQSSSKQEKSPAPVFWPGDLLPTDCPNARIMVYGYDTMVTNLSGGTNRGSVFTHGGDLLFALERKRDRVDRPLLFVAHSLGGIVVKEMLCRSSASQSKPLRDIVENTAAVIFLGTPHRGSTDLAALGEWARGFVSTFRIATNASILDTLGLRTSDLERSQEAFSNLWQTYDFRVKTFHEGLGLTGINLGVLGNKVVPDYSSVIGDAREHAESIDANHMEMCRYFGSEDPNYQKLAGEITSVYASLARLAGSRDEHLRREPSLVDAGNEKRQPDGQVTHGKLGLSAADSNTLQALQFPSMSNRFQTLAKPAEATCLWLFQHPCYQDWIEGRNKDQYGGLLWIKGKPGSGKSLLTKEAYLRALKQEPEPYSTAAYFFNAKGGEYETTPLGLYRSLLHQLLPGSPSCIQRLANLLHQFPGGQESILEDFCREMFVSEFRGRRITVFIDALDECNSKAIRPQAYIWRNITKTAHEAGIDLNVCISSRHFPTISIADCPEIVVEAHNSLDIASFVDRKLSLSIAGGGDPERSTIRNKILEKSAGVFLWVDLVLENVLQKRDEGRNMQSLLGELDSVPEALESLFAQLIQATKPPSRGLTLQVFWWAILATKSLRLSEWHHILAFIKGKPASLASWRESDDFTENDDQLEKQIRSLSMGLLEVAVSTEQNMTPEAMSVWAGAGSLDLEQGETRAVQVIHESVREFFLDGPGFALLNGVDMVDTKASIAAGHLSIMSTCLDYITIEELDKLVDARLSARLQKGPVRERDPARRSSISPENSSDSGSHSSRRRPSIASFGSASSFAGSASARSPLSKRNRKASSRGLSQVSVLDRLRAQSDSAWDRDYSAQRIRTYEITADQISLNPSMQRSVMSRSAEGMSRVLEDYPALLLYVTSALFVHAKAADEAGADPGEVITRLLTKDALWSRWILLREGISLQTRLHYHAASQGLSTWLPVIGRHSDVASGGLSGIMEAWETARKAVRRRNITALELVMDACEPSDWLTDERQGRLLNALVRRSDTALLQTLLSRMRRQDHAEGSSATKSYGGFSWRNANGETALDLAVTRRDVVMALALLAAGASPNIPDGRSGKSTLHIACANTFNKGKSTSQGPDLDLIKLLVEHGANVHASDFVARTPLHCLCHNIPEGLAEGDVAQSASAQVEGRGEGQLHEL